MKILSISGIILSIVSIILLIPIQHHWPEGPTIVLIPISLFFLIFSAFIAFASFRKK